LIECQTNYTLVQVTAMRSFTHNSLLVFSLALTGCAGMGHKPGGVLETTSQVMKATDSAEKSQILVFSPAENCTTSLYYAESNQAAQSTKLVNLCSLSSTAKSEHQ
jgi:hypothetical protein